MKEVQEKPEGDPKVINESKQDSGTFLRIQLNIKGLSINVFGLGFFGIPNSGHNYPLGGLRVPLG